MLRLLVESVHVNRENILPPVELAEDEDEEDDEFERDRFPLLAAEAELVQKSMSKSKSGGGREEGVEKDGPES